MAPSSDFRQLISLALPIMASSMLTFLMTVVDLLFVGRLGTHELAAAALANTVWNTVALPLQGCGSALDTLLSQTFGAGQREAYGRWAQVGTLLMLALGVPFMGILALAEPILLGIRQEPALAASAAEFCARLVWGVPPYMVFMTLTKHLQTQDILLPLVLIALIANAANAAANWLLIYRLGLGLRGAPLATTLSRWLQLLLLGGYMLGARERLAPTLPGRGLELSRLPSRAAQFFRLGAPGALMLALEAWAFDFSTLLAGLLGQVALDAHVVLLNVISFTFMSFPFAMGVAAAIRVGRALGAGDARGAAAAARLAVASVLAFMLSLAALKLCVRRQLGRLFTADDEVVATVARLVLIAALFQVSDGLQAANAGVLRGMGRQRLVAALNLVGFWLLGLPLGTGLTFGARVGVAGLWWGLAAGLTAVASVGVAVVLKTDWEAEARRAQLRAGAPPPSQLPPPSPPPRGAEGHDAGGGAPGWTSSTAVGIEVPPTPPADNVRRPHTVH